MLNGNSDVEQLVDEITYRYTIDICRWNIDNPKIVWDVTPSLARKRTLFL